MEVFVNAAWQKIMQPESDKAIPHMQKQTHSLPS
ncbi:hypothetical protein CHN56_03440 [Bacillus velezensis]|nr:hypothetical protein CHN56_03440 [Bacillus velezensis]